MIRLTDRDLYDARSRVSSAHDLFRGRSGGENIKKGIQTLEVMAGAALSGIAAGRYGAPHLTIGSTNIPMDLVGGLAAHGLAMFGVLGSAGEHVHNVADGVMAQYVARWGVGFGATMRENAGLPRVSGGDGDYRLHGNMPSTGRSGENYRLHGNMPGTGYVGDNYRLHGNMPGTGVGAQPRPLTEAELAGIASRIR